MNADSICLAPTNKYLIRELRPIIDDNMFRHSAFDSKLLEKIDRQKASHTFTRVNTGRLARMVIDDC